MLGAFFAKLEMRTLAVRLRPRATGTINPALLIQLQERPRSAHQAHFAPGEARGGQCRRHAAGGVTDWKNFR
jgi:hypothetical protein